MDHIYRTAEAQLLEREPEHAEAAYLLGAITLESGQAEAAVELFERATALQPDHPAFHSNLGEALRRSGRFPEAVEAFFSAMSLKPHLVEPVFNLGLLLRDAGAIDAAIACFEPAAMTMPDQTEFARQLTLARERRKAQQHRGRSRQPPGNASLHTLSAAVSLRLATLERSLGNPEATVTLGRRALRYQSSLVAAAWLWHQPSARSQPRGLLIERALPAACVAPANFIEALPESTTELGSEAGCPVRKRSGASCPQAKRDVLCHPPVFGTSNRIP